MLPNNIGKISEFATVKSAGTGRGLGVFATSDIVEGSIVFQDDPVAHAESRRRRMINSRQLVCESCNRFVGSFDIQLRLLTGELDVLALLPTDGSTALRQPLPEGAASVALAKEIKLPVYPAAHAICIKQNETERFIFSCSSESCQERIRTKFEQGDGLLQQFLQQSSRTDNTVFSIAGQLCRLSTQVIEAECKVPTPSSDVIQQHLEPLLTLARRPYPECVNAPENEAERAEHTDELLEDMSASLHALCQVYRPHLTKHPHVAELLYSYKNYNLLAGSLCLNLKQSVIPNPLVFALAAVDNLTDPIAKRRAADALEPVHVALSAIHSIMERQSTTYSKAQAILKSKREIITGEEEDDEEDDEDSNSEEAESSDSEEETIDICLKGSENTEFSLSSSWFPAHRRDGLYLRVARLNHSCDPNTEVIYTDSNRAVVLALKDVKAQEELTKAYIDISLPLAERKRELLSYGFECTCSKCLREADNQTRRKRKSGRVHSESDSLEGRKHASLPQKKKPLT
jgi:hypothetical protein